MAYVMLEGYMCECCGYRWAARTGTGLRHRTDPKVCANCRTRYWNKPRRLVPSEKQAAKWNPGTTTTQPTLR